MRDRGDRGRGKREEKERERESSRQGGHPRRRNVTVSMVGLKKKRSHTQKSHPKMVNPRDISRERRRRRKRADEGRREREKEGERGGV